jgi:hypothetical protein
VEPSRNKPATGVLEVGSLAILLSDDRVPPTVTVEVLPLTLPSRTQVVARRPIADA